LNKIDALEGKNAFSNVVVNGTTIKATSQEDTIELEAGTNIALTADAANEKVTIAVTGKVASAEVADTLNGKSASDIIAACSFYMPVGGIIMWSGSASSIPTNWALCNGSNGTPNLFDRMVVCAGNSYAVGAIGGEATHLLTISEMPSHNHTVGWWQSGANTVGGAGGVVTDPPNEGYTTGSDIQIGYTGGSQAHNNMPPYYALAYIMRIA
jgi:microcystin-dependent protein